jgi:hypothetical protein
MQLEKRAPPSLQPYAPHLPLCFPSPREQPPRVALSSLGNDDVITLRAQDDSDSVTLIFESPKADRISGGRAGAGPQHGGP